MSQGFSKFYQVSINENQSEYNGQSESWIVSQWANDTAKVIHVDWRKCDKSRGSWFQSLRLVGLETRVVCWTNHGAACLGVVIWSRQQTERKTKLSKIKAILHYFRDSIVNSSNFILFFGWIKALSMSPTTTRLYFFFSAVGRSEGSLFAQPEATFVKEV